MNDEDSRLLEGCRSGDESAWHELVRRHTRKVFTIAYRFSGRVDESEDLVQEVFLKVYTNLARFEPRAGTFSTWLGTVARNHAIDHYRRRRLERAHTTPEAERPLALPAREERQDRALEREERAQLVRRALRALPNELREALVLCDLQGMAYEQIAETLRIPVGTVKSRINRGRLELARRLLGRAAVFGAGR